MKPSYVYKRFYVLLPSDWVTKYISPENQDLFLRYGERKWRFRFNYNQFAVARDFILGGSILPWTPTWNSLMSAFLSPVVQRTIPFAWMSKFSGLCRRFLF